MLSTSFKARLWYLPETPERDKFTCFAQPHIMIQIQVNRTPASHDWKESICCEVAASPALLRVVDNHKYYCFIFFSWRNNSSTHEWCWFKVRMSGMLNSARLLTWIHYFCITIPLLLSMLSILPPFQVIYFRYFNFSHYDSFFSEQLLVSLPLPNMVAVGFSST